MKRIIVQKTREIHRSRIAYGEVARILVAGECQLLELLQILGIGNDAHGGDDLEIAIIEQAQRQLEMHLVMPGFMRFEGHATVIRHTAALDIEHRHRNIEFDILLIAQIIFDIEFECVVAGQHRFGNGHHTERGNALAQAKRAFVFLLFVLLLAFPMLNFQILKRVAIRDVILVATGDDFAIFDEDGVVAVLLHRVHGRE